MLPVVLQTCSSVNFDEVQSCGRLCFWSQCIWSQLNNYTAVCTRLWVEHAAADLFPVWRDTSGLRRICGQNVSWIQKSVLRDSPSHQHVKEDPARSQRGASSTPSPLSCLPAHNEETVRECQSGSGFLGEGVGDQDGRCSRADHHEAFKKRGLGLTLYDVHLYWGVQERPVMSRVAWALSGSSWGCWWRTWGSTWWPRHRSLGISQSSKLRSC